MDPLPPPGELDEGGTPALASQGDWSAQRMDKLRALSLRYEIRLDFIAKLRKLEGFNTVLLLDDSGSMNAPCAPGGGHTVDPFQAKLPTRWDELKQVSSVLIELATALDPVGPDVYFLNRPPIFCVSDVSQLDVPFSAPPAGFTPISKAFKYILEAKRAVMAEKKLLVIIATDGEPTDDRGIKRCEEFLQDLRDMPLSCHVQIMACTDEEAVMDYLNRADDSIQRLDVTDDYASEREEVLKAQGRSFAFSRGDWIVKAMLGPVLPYFDELDGSGKERERRNKAMALCGGRNPCGGRPLCTLM